MTVTTLGKDGSIIKNEKFKIDGYNIGENGAIELVNPTPVVTTTK